MADTSAQLSEPGVSVPVEASTSAEAEMDDQSEDGQHSHLDSDSTYEIISQSSFHTDDDDDELREDGTDSMLSFEIPTPDGSSIDDEDYVSRQHIDHTETELPPSDEHEVIQGPQLSTPSLDMTPNQSILSSDTVRGTHDDWIRFEEPISSVAGGLFDLSGNHFHEPAQQAATQNKVSMEMTLVDHVVKLDGPFKIMFYATESESHLKEPILEKIGQALHISAATKANESATAKEKLNIVPISSFSNGEVAPDVVLVPYSGLQIEVHDCSAYGLSPGTGGESDPLREKPDLAIFVHRSLSNDFRSVMSDLEKSNMLKERGVPVIDICADRPGEYSASWECLSNPAAIRQLRFKPSKGLAVHMIHTTTEASGEIVYRAPIDHSMFQRMQSVELNKNIAAITERDSILDLKDARWFILSTTKMVWLRILHISTFLAPISRIFSSSLFSTLHSTRINFGKPCFRQLRRNIANIGRDTIVALVFGLLCCSTLWLYRYGTSFTLPRTSGILPATTSPTLVTAPMPTVRKTLEAPTLPPLLSGPSQAPDTRALTAVEYGSLSTVPTAKKSAGKVLAKTVPEFRLVEAKNGHLILHSVQRLPHKWKPPANFVQSHQEGSLVSVSFSRIGDTTFELELGLHKPCSPIILIVQPVEGETLNQAFELPRACQSIASMESLVGAYADARSRILSAALTLRNSVYSHATSFSEDSVRSVNDYYARLVPEAAQKAKESWARVQEILEKAEATRFGFNAWADERLGFLTQNVNTRAVGFGNDFSDRLTVIEADLRHNFELARQRAQRLQKLGLAKISQTHRRSAWFSPEPVHMVHVKVARTRAVRVKDRMLERKTRIWDWVARAREKLHKGSHLRQERRSYRSTKCGRHR